MDFNDTKEEAEFRARARAFLQANAKPKAGSRPVLRALGVDAEGVKACKAWQVKKADAGFAARQVPAAVRPNTTAAAAQALPAAVVAKCHI